MSVDGNPVHRFAEFGKVIQHHVNAVEESLKRVAVDVRGEVVPECVHFVPEEAPDLIAGRLLTFFGEENG